MTKLTKEHLEEIAELARKATYKPCAMHMTNLLVVCDSEVIEEMARQLLASMEQEPVSYTCSDALDDVYCGSAAMMGPVGAVGEVPLYAAPQLPQPAPVVQPVMFIDGDISASDAEKLAAVIREWDDAPAPERDQVRRDHAAWSQATFGNVGPVGPLKHLSKEAQEAAAEPGDLSEWADMQFLLWDAQRRAGISDEQITQAMVEKLAINKQREWPEPKDGEPRLHIKKAGNSPVTQDGWQLVPKEPTEAMNKAGWAAMNEHDAINPTYRAMLAAAPQQEVKSALEHGMRRYAGAMQKLSEGDK